MLGYARRLVGRTLPKHDPIAAAADKLNQADLSDKNEIDLLGYRIAFLGDHHLRYLFREIFVDESYAFSSETDSPVIVDCGSNIGMALLYFHYRYPRARLMGFEPDPATFRVLERNTQRNLSNSDVTVFPVALGCREQSATLYRDHDPNSSSLLMSLNPERHSGIGIHVEVKRLSSYIHTDIDLLKIDVEGAEFEVMHDLIETGTIDRVKRICLEYHHHIGSEPDRLSEMLRMIEESGFCYHLRAISGSLTGERKFQDITVLCHRP